VPLNPIRREPLVLFVAGGAALFFAWTALAPREVQAVEIESAALRGLVTMQEELLGRPLTDDERAEVREGYFDDEVLVQEALRRGLHLGDYRTRKRLIQIMRSAMTVTVPDPSLAELQAWFRESIDKYTRPPSATVELVPFPWGDGTSADEIAEALVQLQTGADPQEFGQTGLGTNRRLGNATRADLVRSFGPDFADLVVDLPAGQWHGPFESVHGVHLVRVVERHPAQTPSFEDMEPYLQQDWLMTRTRELQQQRIDELRAEYRIELIGE